MHKDGSLRDLPLQEVEGDLLVLGPLPCLVLLEEIMEGSCNVRESGYPPTVEVHKPNEFLHSPD